MTVNDALRAIAGFFVLASVALGYFVHPGFFLFTAFVGANLLQSGFSKWCPMMLDPEEGGREGRPARAQGVLLRRRCRVNIAVSFPGGVAVEADVKGHLVRTDQPRPSAATPPPRRSTSSSPRSRRAWASTPCASARSAGSRRRGSGSRSRPSATRRRSASATIEVALTLPPGFPEKYQGAIGRAVDQCAVKKHMVEPPAFALTVN